MTSPHCFSTTPGVNLRPLYLINRDGLAGWYEQQPQATTQWLIAHGFDAAPSSLLALPGGDGNLAGAVLGIGDALDPYSYAHARYALPMGDWQVIGEFDTAGRNALQLGWGLGSYRYSRFRDPPRAPARLLLDAPDAETCDVLAACMRVRDLVNTPAEQLGPEQLEQVVCEIALAHGALPMPLRCIEPQVGTGKPNSEACLPTPHSARSTGSPATVPPDGCGHAA